MKHQHDLPKYNLIRDQPPRKTLWRCECGHLFYWSDWQEDYGGWSHGLLISWWRARHGAKVNRAPDHEYVVLHGVRLVKPQRGKHR